MCKIKEHIIMREKLDKICSILMDINKRHMHIIARLYNVLHEHNILVTIEYAEFFQAEYITIKNEKISVIIIYDDEVQKTYIYVKDIEVTYIEGNWYTYINNKLLPEIMLIIEPMYNDMLREEEKSKNDMLEECNKIFIEDIDKEDKPTLSFIDKIKIFLRGKKKEKVNGR